MKTPLAWLNLWHNKARSLVAIAGVTFAVVLILMQLGFLGSVRQTATRVYGHLEFDLLLASRRYAYLSRAGIFDRQRLIQAMADPDVASAIPFYLGFSLWRHPDEAFHERRRGILVMGFDPDLPVFDLPEIRDAAAPLRLPGACLMDRLSRREFGPRRVGMSAEIGRMEIHLAGEFSLGTGFGADGAVVVGDRTFVDLFPGRTEESVSLGLIRLRPNADPDQVARRLGAVLPDDVQVLTRKELEAKESDHWVNKTSVGVIFTLGVVVALIVGTAIVYQVLSSDIDSRLGEYATLKAMGYGSMYLTRVVLSQAVILAVAGFLPGWGLSRLFYDMTSRAANLPMDLPAARVAAVFGMSVAMCCVSGVASLRKVQSADPADLFR